MKSDIDVLMERRNFDALFVMGESLGNHVLHYLTNGVKVTHAMVLKKRNQQPIIICNPMERDEAAKSGLRVYTTTEFNYAQLIKEGGNYYEGQLLLIKKILEHFQVAGTVSFYGRMDPGEAYMTLRRLDTLLPNITITGETDVTLFDEAVGTKSQEEITHIRNVAERTNLVMSDVMAFITDHDVVNGALHKQDGEPLTVRDVKLYLQIRLLAHDLDDNNTTIFAIGRDAGVPHSRGEDDDILELGKSIIFDLFPKAVDTGYYHDMTRTFCLGYAPAEVQRAYDQVIQAMGAVLNELSVGQKASTYQDIVCDVFEEHGHPTPRANPGTDKGYVHSVGHGIGIQIHERPRFGSISEDVIKNWQVFTVEPGLYYPENGFGVRVEDTVYIDGDGNVHTLTTYPKDLVIPMGSKS